MVSKLSEIWSGLFIPDPDPDFLPIPDPGSRGQKGTGSRVQGSKRHRIPDPDPQHCCLQGKQEDDSAVDYNDDADLLTDFFFTDADLKVIPTFFSKFICWHQLAITYKDR
jgi:hypothetical protein